MLQGKCTQKVEPGFEPSSARRVLRSGGDKVRQRQVGAGDRCHVDAADHRQRVHGVEAVSSALFGDRRAISEPCAGIAGADDNPRPKPRARPLRYER